MTEARERKLRQAAAYLKQDQTERARALLVEIVKADPHAVRAWILLARTAESRARRIQVLERCLALNPESELAQRAISEVRARDAGSTDGAPPQKKRTSETSPWLWVGAAAGALVLVAAALGVIFGLASRPAAAPPTATSIPPTATALPATAAEETATEKTAPAPTPSSTATARPSPTPSPTPVETEQLETWVPPVTASQILSSTCGNLLAVAEAMAAETETLEYEIEVSTNAGVVSAMASGLKEASLNDWEAPGSLTTVKAALESQRTTLQSVTDRWLRQEITGTQVLDAIRGACRNAGAARDSLLAAAARNGFSEEALIAAAGAADRETRDAAPPRPDEPGASRARPYAQGEVGSADDWLVQVIETVRGEEAWQRIRTLPYAAPAPEGQTYLLVHVHVRNNAAEAAERRLNRHDFAVTGEGLRRYEADPFVSPQPEFDVNLPGGFEATGWLTFLIPEEEHSLLLVFDPYFGDRAIYIALEDGASVAMPVRDALPTPNELGVEPDAPVPFGETAVTRDWAVTLLETIRGREAWALLEGASIFNEPPPENQEYLLVRARVQYLNAREEVGEVSGYSFSVTGNPDASPPDVTGLTPSLAARLYPGGEVTGWFELVVAGGQPVRIVFEPPMQLTGEQRRYLALP